MTVIARFLLCLVLSWAVSFGAYAQSISLGAGLSQGQVSGFGDSITAGNQDASGVTWPGQLLGQKPTFIVNNNGIGGQGSGQIAVRMNAYPGQTQQTFDVGFTLPTSGQVAVHFPAFYDPCYRAFAPGIILQVVLSGTPYLGYCIDPGTHLYLFTPINFPASPISVSAGTNWTPVTRTQLNGCIVIEEGINNGLTAPTQVLADIAASVATAQSYTTCWMVMTLLNDAETTQWSGQADYNSIIALNTALISAYGSHVIDIRTNLINAYDPSNAADVIDHGHDVPPYSLRAGDLSGTTGAIADTSTCAFTTTAALANGNVVTVGSEKVFISGGSSGSYTCTRGYASTTAVTHISSSAFTAVDVIHPGQNATSAANPNFTNGYTGIATWVKNWIDSNGF
jgi:hypothetical protein